MSLLGVVQELLLLAIWTNEADDYKSRLALGIEECGYASPRVDIFSSYDHHLDIPHLTPCNRT